MNGEGQWYFEDLHNFLRVAHYFVVSRKWRVLWGWHNTETVFLSSEILNHSASGVLELFNVFFLSLNLLELPGPVLTQSRLRQEWQERFAIQFTFVNTKEIATISINLSWKVAAASVVTFWRICAMVLFCILFLFSVVSWGSFHYMPPCQCLCPAGGCKCKEQCIIITGEQFCPLKWGAHHPPSLSGFDLSVLEEGKQETFP